MKKVETKIYEDGYKNATSYLSTYSAIPIYFEEFFKKMKFSLKNMHEPFLCNIIFTFCRMRAKESYFLSLCSSNKNKDSGDLMKIFVLPS